MNETINELFTLLERNRGQGSTTELARAAIRCGGTLIVANALIVRELKLSYPELNVCSMNNLKTLYGKDNGPVFVDVTVLHTLEISHKKEVGQYKEKLDLIRKVLNVDTDKVCKGQLTLSFLDG